MNAENALNYEKIHLNLAYKMIQDLGFTNIMDEKMFITADDLK